MTNNMIKANQIGSVNYIRTLKQSGLNAHEQLDLIINHHLQAYIDNYGFLQFSPTVYQFSPQLAPTSFFYPYFRDLVVTAYSGKKGLKADLLGRKIHLFRSYLDRQNIAFIRRYQCPSLSPEATDFQLLLSYAHDYHFKLDFKTGANYHNRYHHKFTYPSNMKVQLVRNSYRRYANPARMIEFIVDIETGKFISQWNIYRFDNQGRVDSDPTHYSTNQLRQIADTESFNYGIPYGEYYVTGKYRHTHQRLDITQPTDSQLRRIAKKYWQAPIDYDDGGNYADLVKNMQDVIAWRGVPDSQRIKVYADYVNSLKEHQCKNSGINHFFAKNKAYQQFSVPWWRRLI